MTEVWYRYEDAGWEDGPILLSEYPVIKHTPKGVWIQHWMSERGKFIRLDTTKQWASPTIEAARTSYIARKRKQVQILAAQHDRAVTMFQRAQADKWEVWPLPVGHLQFN